MIFISHNYKDKAIVEPIAIRLKEIFGQENVFYDSWSIQPGDGIIDKMNDGLAHCKLFFFFVSTNSLNSEMVKLEWQNAVMKMTNGQIKIIPVRLDNCTMPPILLQSLYIDLYQYGLEVAIRQIVDIAMNRNTFSPQFNEVSNLVAYKWWEGNTMIIECHAQYYREPIAHFAFLTFNTQNQINFGSKNNIAYRFGFNVNCIETNVGIKLNAIRIDFPESIVPGFPQSAEFTAKTEIPIEIMQVLHENKKDAWKNVPIISQKPQK
mgnify:CR=1 FL=1